MTEANLSPIEVILKKRREAKKLPSKIYEMIFDSGAEKTAEIFEIKPEEAINLVSKVLRKNGELDRLMTLTDCRKIDLINSKIEELNSFSTTKIYEECKDFAKVWEIAIAKHMIKQKLKKECWD
jgi:hypothetical protein